MRTFSFDGEVIQVREANLAPVCSRPKISVVLTACKRAKQLRKTLESLRWQTMWRYMEMIVVEADYDGGETQAVAKEYCATYLRRLNVADRRTAVTNNIGIRSALGEIVVLQCAEIRHESEDTIEKLVAPIIADPNVSTFPMVVDLDANGVERGWKFHPASHPNCFITFCQAFAKQAAVRIGGFDENFVNWGGEDNFFNFSLQWHGVKCLFINTIVAHQWHEPVPENEKNSPCWEYYHKRIAEIKLGKDDGVSNKGKTWGDSNN